MFTKLSFGRLRHKLEDNIKKELELLVAGFKGV
jgi:hypothetical protein